MPNNLNHHLDLPTLESWLWEAACGIRGPIDAPKYREYILPLLFYKRLSDVYEDEITRIAAEFGDADFAREMAALDRKLTRVYIPPEHTWSEVRAFSKRVVARLPEPEPAPRIHLSAEQLHARVADWAGRIGVEVGRVQVREMRTKCTSCSSQGTITLNTHILALPPNLVDYVIVHELLHLKFPGHGKGWQAMMAVYLPGWRELEQRLMGRYERGGEGAAESDV